MSEPGHAPDDPGKRPRHAPTEPGVLRVSIAATAVVAALGIVFGLLSGSYAIVFDGIYSLADGATSMVALLVANLIAGYNATGAQNRRLVEKFTMGFWHLEPMVLGATGLLLSGAAVYAFINAVGSFMSGGRPLQFGQAIVYAVVTVLISLVMAGYGRRANRRLRSDLVAMDVRGWMMSAAITAALLVAFVLGLAIQGTSLEWMSPYIDPAVLALVCLVVFPTPLGAVRQALQEILLVTPAELKRHVDEVAQRTVERHGFLGYRAYVAKVGRGRQIELYFIAPAGWPARTLEQWDALRDEIGEAIGGDSPDRWLTIAFTTDREWAE
ncbi:cation diffusion facilitator family transporter [Pseudoxanthomonas suwonensis]|uniref:Cation diffusion facilitator family transporter n=1 Tax=Pseudoxanthomonas suwonensis TaxID=314722 RepID=A0A0E3UN21_9GAMM|nr:cation transporter [Pseudoxanthomonas suwonensis]AKC86821.1 cation diffusion facilitator family transporter [Pseudoxanthomonas suwonensis]